jgi:hypothetical protein
MATDTMSDEDARTSLWRPASAASDELFVVLPAREDFTDYGQLVGEALRAVAYKERRSVEEISADISYGASDTVAARLVPEAPPGEAPLSLAYSALRYYVIGSASALDTDALVLPARRSMRAESYVGKIRFTTQPGSFILALSLPLVDTFNEAPGAGEDLRETETAEPVQDPLLEVPHQPFGRRITNRMASVARSAQLLADAVYAGQQPLRAFGVASREAANATELEALSGLGGPERSPYRLRFAQSPLGAQSGPAAVMQVTPGQQRIMAEAAEYLRTQQSRADVTVDGIVVRLSRDRHHGPGVVVIEGAADDSGAIRRFYAELAEREYDEAIRAHGLGLRVVARGDLITRGSYKWLRPARSFAIIPGLEYDEIGPE